MNNNNKKPEFQFLMVRLKVKLSVSIVKLPPFQFLMVRLKVIYRKFYKRQKYISIPYGSIKRKSKWVNGSI